jgi:hypothetical protein
MFVKFTDKAYQTSIDKLSIKYKMEKSDFKFKKWENISEKVAYYSYKIQRFINRDLVMYIYIVGWVAQSV